MIQQVVRSYEAGSGVAAQLAQQLSRMMEELQEYCRDMEGQQQPDATAGGMDEVSCPPLAWPMQ